MLAAEAVRMCHSPITSVAGLRPAPERHGLVDEVPSTLRLFDSST